MAAAPHTPPDADALDKEDQRQEFAHLQAEEDEIQDRIAQGEGSLGDDHRRQEIEIERRATRRGLGERGVTDDDLR